MVLRERLKYAKMQRRKTLDIHIFKLLKIENIKVRLMLQNLSASLEMKGLGYMKYLLLSRMYYT